jgi:2,4-dienoyl-CoA reductase-like NADH-dependent reductase (Old Yellow Enzyme family)
MQAGNNTKEWKLLEPIKIGPMPIKNRIVMSPMATNLPASDGSATDKMIDYYSERAKGGVGLVIVEDTYTDEKESKQAREHQLGAYSDHLIPKLNKLAEAINSNRARAMLQISHAGRQTSRADIGRQPVAPSGVLYQGEVPKELTLSEIQEIQCGFAEAARRLKQSGFDGVEVHGAHGYLLSQFVSSYTNRRNDSYGGSIENKALFALEIIQKVREKVGDQFVVGYRMNGDDYLPGGVSPDEVVRLSEILADAGVDYIHLSVGMQESLQYTIQPMYLERGCLIHLAELVKKSVNIPVITAASHNGATAEKSLREGKADLVAFGRALLADPGLPNKLLGGRLWDIRPCIRGNEGCISNIPTGHPIRCEVNPAVGREAEFKVVPSNIKKNVLVIGGA